MTPEQLKAMESAASPSAADLRSSIDAIEKIHGVAIAMLAHHRAGIMRTLEANLPEDLRKQILGHKMDDMLEDFCMATGLSFEQICRVSGGIKDTICLLEADMHEAFKSAFTGENNGQ